MSRSRLVSRIAIFAALVYVLGLATVFIPNVNLAFFVVFVAGMIWGTIPGVLVGAIGMGLWTFFNPYGPALPPIALCQISGAAASGIVGALFSLTSWSTDSRLRLTVKLIVSAIGCTLLFFIPVTLADAWLFQPFWVRFLAGLPWVAISLVFNTLIFPLLFPVARHLYRLEKRRR